MKDLFKELGDLEQNIFILEQVKKEKNLTVDEQTEIEKEIKECKRKITIINNKLESEVN